MLNSCFDRVSHFRLKKIAWAEVVLLILSVVLTTWLIFSAQSIETIFLDHWPHFFDPVSYDLTNILLYKQVKKIGILQTVFSQIQLNDRNPFRTVPLILLCPRLLAKTYGQTFTAIPHFLSFVFLLGLCTYRQSKSLLLAIASILVFCALPGWTNPIIGIGPNWLDMPASMSAGSAILSLMMFTKTKRCLWIGLFGIFCTLTATSRWSASLYLIFSAGPALLWSFFTYYQAKNTISKPLIIFLLTAGSGIIFTASHWIANFAYYKTYNYGLGAPVLEAFSSIVRMFMDYCGRPFLLIFFALFVWHTAATILKKGEKNFQPYLMAVSYPLLLMIFICFFLRISKEVHSIIYLVPAMVLASIAIGTPITGVQKHLYNFALVALMGWSLLSLHNMQYVWHQFALNPPEPMRLQKLADSEIASTLASYRIDKYAEYDDERMQASVESFYKSGWLPESIGFTTHYAYWRGQYPNLDGKQIAQQLYTENCNKVGLIVILERMSDLTRDPNIDNPISLEVAATMMKKVPLDPLWKKIDAVEGPAGRLALYLNTSLVK